MSYSVRFNGTAPAWPVMLGQKHPFYDPEDRYSLASASCSIVRNPEGSDLSQPKEILIDAGHETVSFLLQNGNRLPEAIILTHGHPDHVLGVDWIVQSLRFTREGQKRMPVYCTRGTWESLMRSWSHITDHVEHHLLVPGKKLQIGRDTGIEITPYPVYHGPGATGASMLLAEFPGSEANPILITGDLLFPMLRSKDIEQIRKAETMVVDCNNRYPYPASNHISFTAQTPDGDESEILREWLLKQDIKNLVAIHRKGASAREELDYWDEFQEENPDLKKMTCSVLELTRLVQARKVSLTHYFGLYDLKVYKQQLPDRRGFEKWAEEKAAEEGEGKVSFSVPRAGDLVRLY